MGRNNFHEENKPFSWRIFAKEIIYDLREENNFREGNFREITNLVNLFLKEISYHSLFSDETCKGEELANNVNPFFGWM